MHVANNSGDMELQSKQAIENMIRESATKPWDDIWISGVEEYPSLSILVNGNSACLHYVVNDTGDIWQSVGDRSANVTFETGDGNPAFAPKEATISLEKAIACMYMFCDNLLRPSCIQWREL